MSSEPSEPLQDSLSSTYDNPHDFVHDIVNGKVALESVPMNTWIEATLMAMVDKKQPHLDLTLGYGGGVYHFHHCVKTVNPPASAQAVLETRQ